MGKISKEQQWRMEGFSYAIRQLESGKTLDDLKAEAKLRGVYGIPIDISKAELSNFSKRVKKTFCQTVLLMTCHVLADEFGFGKKRISRYIEKFDNRLGAVGDNLISWLDIKQLMEDETGIIITFDS